MSNRQPLVCLDNDPGEPRPHSGSQAVDAAKALGHPIRLQIVGLFQAQCPRNVREIVVELPLAQSTVTTHLRILRQAGVIRTLREDPRAWMCINRSVLQRFTASINELTERSLTH